MGVSNGSVICLYDKCFEPFISYAEIEKSIEKIACLINDDYKELNDVLFLCVLNGAFMFASELLHNINFNCAVSFVKLASYNGVGSTGVVNELLGVDCDLSGKRVIVVEDIVDTGCSMNHLLGELKRYNPSSIEIATLFYKPESCKYSLPVKYCAMELPNDFIVGFGLDYDGLGRNYKDIYRLVDEKS